MYGRWIGKLKGNIHPRLLGSARQGGFSCLREFLLDPETTESALEVNSTKAHQGSKNKLLRTRILFSCLFLPWSHSSTSGLSKKPDSTNTARKVWSPKAGVLHLLPSFPAARGRLLWIPICHIRTWCAQVQLRVGLRQGLLCAWAVHFALKGKNEAAQI